MPTVGILSGMKRGDRILSRIGLEVRYKDYVDKNAIIGYDDSMKTWFLQAFEIYNKDTDSDELLLWLGSQEGIEFCRGLDLK